MLWFVYFSYDFDYKHSCLCSGLSKNTQSLLLPHKFYLAMATVKWDNNRITFHPGTQTFTSAAMQAAIPGPVANAPNWHLTFTGITTGIILNYPGQAPVNLTWVGHLEEEATPNIHYHATRSYPGSCSLHQTNSIYSRHESGQFGNSCHRREPSSLKNIRCPVGVNPQRTGVR